MATMQRERLRPLAEAERRELVAIAKASNVLQLDPPAWKASDHVKVINGRIYPLSGGAQTIAHAGSGTIRQAGPKGRGRTRPFARTRRAPSD